MVIIGRVATNVNKTAEAWDNTGTNPPSLMVCYNPPVYYTLTAGNDGHGSVTLSPTGGTYTSGTVVTLTPAPNSGYAFSSWSGTNAGDIVNTGGVVHHRHERK